MAPTPMKLRTDFELTCFTYEGIDAIKEALLTSRAKVNAKDPKIQISVSPPRSNHGSSNSSHLPTIDVRPSP